MIDLGTVTLTAPANGAATVISAPSTGMWDLTVNIQNLTCASGTPRARITWEDTVDNFTTPLVIAAYNIEGPITSPTSFSFTRDQIPSLRVGTASAKLRCNLIALEGTTPTITFGSTLSGN